MAGAIFACRRPASRPEHLAAREAIALDHPAAAAGSSCLPARLARPISVPLFQMQTPMTAAMICAAVAECRDGACWRRGWCRKRSARVTGDGDLAFVTCRKPE
jgi:hypothetical protein